MAGSDNQDEFLARIARIEQKRGGAMSPPPGGTNPSSGSGGGPLQPQKSPSRLLRLLAVVFVGVCFLVVIGGVVFFSSQPQLLVEMMTRETNVKRLTEHLASAPSFDSFDGLVASGPKERKLGDTGWEVPADYVAHQNQSDLTLARVARQTDPTASPARERPEIVSFFANSDCTLRRPNNSEVVHTVRLNDTARYTNMHMFSKSDLAQAVIDRISGLQSTKKNYKNAAIAEGRMGQVDVFVTDLRKPVYLMLQSFNRDIAWNIHLAPGVTLSHVAVIGRKTAIAGPDTGFTVEALRIEDYLKDDDSDIYENREPRRCMIAPFREVQGHWPLHDRLDHPIDGAHYTNQMRTLSQGHAAFAIWYNAQTGLSPNTNLTQIETAANAIAGPIPDDPILQTPIQHRRIHAVENDFVVFGNEELDAPHHDLLMAATGGDLALLNPASIRRVEH